MNVGALSESKRRAASEKWMKALDRYHVNLTDAGKPFKDRWVDSPSQLSDELTYAADILWALSNSLTEKSAPIFTDKVSDLVRCRREHGYQQRLSELELGALLASRVSPIAFEPVVPRGADPAKKPSSTDYSVSLPCGEVFIESTTIKIRNEPADVEVLFKQLVNKLVEKRQQAFRDRVYLLAMKVLGPSESFLILKELINGRVWPNRKFRRYSGIFVYLAEPSAIGHLTAAWLPNKQSTAPIAGEVDDLFSGRRCFHLDPVKTIQFSEDDVLALRRRVTPPEGLNGIWVPVRLQGGPLDGIQISVRPSQVGDIQITYSWELEGSARLGRIDRPMPPHGPIQVVYERQSDTLYQFSKYRVWIDEYRPTVPRNEYLLRLNLCN